MKKYFAIASIISLLLIPNLAPTLAEGISAAEIISQTNIHRQSNNLALLQTSALLQKAAQMKAQDMAAKGYFSHNSPEGKTPWDWMASAGYNFKTAGENIALGYQTSKATVDGWMNSPGHRANILNGNFTQIGIGIAAGKYNGKDSTFIVQMLAAPMGSNRGDTIISNPPATPKPSPKPIATPKPKPPARPAPQKPAPTPIPAPPQTPQPTPAPSPQTQSAPPILFCSMDEIFAKKFTRILPTRATPEASARRAQTPRTETEEASPQNNLFKWIKSIFIWPFWDK